jgi:hypothetical protein
MVDSVFLAEKQDKIAEIDDANKAFSKALFGEVKNQFRQEHGYNKKPNPEVSFRRSPE